MQERGNPALKRIDRWVGVPLVCAIGLLRRCFSVAARPPDMATIVAGPRATPLVITLLKSAAIGDTVLLSAVVRDLRAALPQCRLRLACGSSNAVMADMVEGLDEVIVLPMSRPLALWRMVRRLRSGVFVDLDSWPRINALIAFGSRSAATIGFSTAGQHRHALYDLALDHSFALHEVDNYRRLVEPVVAAAGRRIDGPPEAWLRIPAPRSTDHDVDAATIVFHMHSGGSQARFKEWPQSRWLELARQLVGRGHRVRLSGGPSEVERNQRFARDASAGVAVLAPRALAPLAATLRQAAAVVTVDTGIAHLAGAAGARTLVLHGPTAPERWGALGPNVRYLKDDQMPWIQLGFEESPVGTPVRLSVQQVLDAVVAMVDADALSPALPP